MQLTPHEPPFAHGDLSVVGGRIGSKLEDFRVDEVPLYPASGEGDHWYVRLRKRGLTTQQLIGKLRDITGASDRDIGSAGMKDKHAITSQWLSVPVLNSPEPASWELPSDIELLEHSRHGNTLRTGHLVGNRFEIRLVELPEDYLPAATAMAERLQQQGLPNYYSGQRFGREGRNLRDAHYWIGNPRAHKRTPRHKRKLYPSVLQSEIFNRYLTARYALDPAVLIQGEVVRLSETRSSFVVEDLSAEQPRLDAGQIHLLGPMPGPKMKAATGVAGELEARILQELELSIDDFAALGKLAQGTRRDLRLFPESLQLSPDGARELIVRFALPSGSYATEVLRQFTGAGLLEARAFPPPPPEGEPAKKQAESSLTTADSD